VFAVTQVGYTDVAVVVSLVTATLFALVAVVTTPVALVFSARIDKLRGRLMIQSIGKFVRLAHSYRLVFEQ